MLPSSILRRIKANSGRSIYSYGTLKIYDSCIIENSATYALYAGSGTINTYNTTIDKPWTGSGSVSIQDMSSSFLRIILSLLKQQNVTQNMLKDFKNQELVHVLNHVKSTEDQLLSH